MKKTPSIIFFFLMCGILTAPTDQDDAFAFFFGPHVTVMTQNLYVGADIMQLLEVDLGDLRGAFTAIGDLLLAIAATNFPERAEVLADEIQSLQPDLIGLQELSLIRYQYPSDFFIGNPLPASRTIYDFLAILLDALAARGLQYEVAAIIENADVEFPALVVLDDETSFFIDARMTDHDAIIKRRDVMVSNVVNRNYTRNLRLTFGPIVLEVKRGFTAVDATVEGKKYRFVNTHLETEGPGFAEVRVAQAMELLEALDGERLPTILVGDFNSAPEGPETEVYHLFRNAGFTDAWTYYMGYSEPGFTCCQQADLMNEKSTLTQRIDHVFIRNDFGVLPFSILGPGKMTIIGADPGDKTPITGLWPSDHAGVAASFRFIFLTP